MFDLLSESDSKEPICFPPILIEGCSNINDEINYEIIHFNNADFKVPNDTIDYQIEQNEELLNYNCNEGTKKTNYTGKSNHTLVGKKREKSVKPQKKFRPDNILTKINIHFLNFLVMYINFLLNFFDIEEKFLKIDYKCKKITNEYFQELKNKILKDILIEDISRKYRNYKKDKNKNVVKKIINIPFLKKLLSEKYIDIFINIYYKNERIINLEKYGKNNNINIIKLPKTGIKMFDDFIEKLRKTESQEYIEKIKKFVFKKFIKGDN